VNVEVTQSKPSSTTTSVSAADDNEEHDDEQKIIHDLLSRLEPPMVSIWQPCSLWKPSPSHPIVLVLTRGLAVFYMCLSLLCTILYVYVYFLLFAFLGFPL